MYVGLKFDELTHYVLIKMIFPTEQTNTQDSCG